MQVLFLGGASEVGASCLAIEIAGFWIVVDVGIRIGASDPLPDLAQLEDKKVCAIFITHAHADHIGALPLVHHAFPHAPIYASRATGLLMEVMLSDAVKIMERRATEEMELPLYPPALVSGMLQLVRPLPTETPCTLPELPGVMIQASRAGHIAGAVSLSFEAPDGSVVISGDISLTEQRTVLPAQTPPVELPDLLILESTYGTRLHANRQAEEARFAQAVANGIGRGGHVLIPAFGLGRGQEVLLILQDAIQKKQIPAFPLAVDGLVRRVCATYLLLPEALSPKLSRQIRKGYQPFSNKLVRFMRDERDRERILAGEPICIVSSSGMLTGGPSAWYAARLAAEPSASILITGYQDEESPGRRLLDVAEHHRDTLEIEGKTVQVRCQVAKYSLSAHADSGELATYAAALKPRQVALVHGDDEARAALRIRLAGTTVLLPQNGTAIRVSRSGGKHRAADVTAAAQVAFPTGIGAGRVLSKAHLSELWQTISSSPALRIVTAREVAHIWYGEDSQTATSAVLDVLSQDTGQRYFVPQHALEEAFRVRGRQEADRPSLGDDLVGRILFLQVSPGSAQPAFCRALVPVASVRVQLPKGEQERTRYPYSAILDVLGPLPSSVDETRIASYLAELKRSARQLRKTLSARTLASLCAPEARYSLTELCTLASLEATDLASRLAIAKVVQQAPRLFAYHSSVLDGEGEALYQLAPEWREALSEPSPVEEHIFADQQAILQVLSRYLGDPPDLYRRSVHPETGDVTLAFHFPAMAQKRYEAAIAAAAEESGLKIRLTEQPHQGKLAERATAHLPAGLRQLRPVSLYHDRQLACVECEGSAEPEAIAGAAARFQEETGWQLSITRPSATTGNHLPMPVPPSLPAPRTHSGVWGMNEAVQYAQQCAASLPGYLRVRVESGTRTLLLRFTFPEVAQARYQPVAEEIKTTTGWHVRFAGESNQEALREMAEQVLPAGLVKVDTVSFYHDTHQVYLTCLGEATPSAVAAAQERYRRETGWQLTILGVAGNALAGPDARPRMTQAQAMECASQLLRGEASLYQIGADEKRKVLWLHFHFPTVASRRLAAQIRSLEEETGWGVQIRQDVHQRALFELAVGFLPQAVTVIGKKLVRQEERTLQLTCLGQISPKELQALQERFREETDWSLDLVFAAPPSTGSETDTHRLSEALATSYLHAQMREAGLASCRIGVDTVRGKMVLRDQTPGVTTSQIRQWEEETGWQIELTGPDAAVYIPQELFSLPIEALAISGDIIECLSAHQITTVGQILEQDEMTLRSIIRPEQLACVAQQIQQRRWLPLPQSQTIAEAGAQGLPQD